MSTTSSKFSVENFEPAPDDELICSICRCIFDEPMECPCRHIFCRACISNWLELKRSCPICRKYVSSFDIKSVAPLIKNMISKLTMICPFRNNGCRSKITLDSYNSHVSHCLYEIISCKNSNCSGMYLRKDIEEHEKVACEFRLIMCESDCNLMLPLSRVKKHNCVRELKQRLEESTKREETLNKHIEELTNELNTLKKKNASEESRRFFPYFSFISSDDGSNSYADSLSTEANEYLSDSHHSLFQNLRSRLSNLTMSLTDLEGSLVSSNNNNNNRSRNNSNTVGEERRPSDMSLEIISDIDNNNSTLSTVGSLGSTSDQSSSNYTVSSSDSDSIETSTASQSVLEIAGSDDDEIPTVAQRRILKRKHASVVSVSSESDEGSIEVHTRRRRSTEQRNQSRTSSDAQNSTKNSNKSGSKAKSKINNVHPTSYPRSLVPVEVSGPVRPHTVFPTVSNSRSVGLEKTRELLEMFSVETDPDWEPSDGLSSEDELPVVRSVPAADLLDHILDDDSDVVYESPDADNTNASDVESDDDNYEVLVPERTYDLLVRYSQEDSQDDGEWLPRHLRLDTSEESDGELRPR